MKRSRLSRKHDPLKKRLDSMARELTFLRDGHKCVYCGKSSGLQWCHVRSRRYLSTRWSGYNLLSLCSGHHLDQHANPLKWAAWFVEKYPERAKLIRLADQTAHRVDMKLIELELKQELARYA